MFDIWPWPLTLPVTLVMVSQGQILKLPYLQNIRPDRKKDKTRVNSLDGLIFHWNIWSMFCLRHMLQCRSGVTFLSLTTSLWSYHYRNGDGAHSGYNTGWGAVLGFTQYIHRSCMKFAKFEVTRANVRFELWSNLLHQLKNIWNADRLVQGWTDGARCDYTLWPRAKMEHSGRIQYCISI